MPNKVEIKVDGRSGVLKLTIDDNKIVNSKFIPDKSAKKSKSIDESDSIRKFKYFLTGNDELIEDEEEGEYDEE